MGQFTARSAKRPQEATSAATAGHICRARRAGAGKSRPTGPPWIMSAPWHRRPVSPSRTPGTARRGPRSPSPSKLSPRTRNGPSGANTRPRGHDQRTPPGAGQISTRSGPGDRRPAPRKFSQFSNGRPTMGGGFGDIPDALKGNRAPAHGGGGKRNAAQNAETNEQPERCALDQRTEPRENNKRTGTPYQQTAHPPQHDTRATGAARRY